MRIPFLGEGICVDSRATNVGAATSPGVLAAGKPDHHDQGRTMLVAQTLAALDTDTIVAAIQAVTASVQALSARLDSLETGPSSPPAPLLRPPVPLPLRGFAPCPQGDEQTLTG